MDDVFEVPKSGKWKITERFFGVDGTSWGGEYMIEAPLPSLKEIEATGDAE